MTRPTFGTLRSQLQDAATTPQTLWPTLEALYEANAALYLDEIVPYLQGFSARFDDAPLCTVHTTEDLARAVKIAPMGRFTLALPTGQKSKAILAMLKSPGLANLYALNLAHSRVGVQATRALKKATTLTTLHTLTLVGALNKNSFPALLDSPTFTNLKALDLSYNTMSGQPLEQLASAFSNLHTLRLASASLLDTDIAALVETLPNLETLDITFNEQLGPSSFADIAKHCTNLRALHSYGARPQVEGLTMLGHSAALANGVEQLMMVSTYVGSQLVEALFNAHDWTSLELLDIRNNRIGDQGIEALAHYRLGALTTLNVGNNHLGARGIKAIVEAPWANQLTSLCMNATPLNDRAIDTLAQADALSNLRWIELGFTAQTPEQWQTLLNSPYLHDDVKHLIEGYRG